MKLVKMVLFLLVCAMLSIVGAAVGTALADTGYADSGRMQAGDRVIEHLVPALDPELTHYELRANLNRARVAVTITAPDGSLIAREVLDSENPTANVWLQPVYIGDESVTVTYRCRGRQTSSNCRVKGSLAFE